jgi:hypothetical protein
MCLLPIGLGLAFAGAADADFIYVRSIPSPDIPALADCVTGLDHIDSALVVTSAYVIPGDATGGSIVFRIDPSTGAVLRQEEFPGVPLDCASNYWQLSAVACRSDGGEAYWAADSCGEIARFSWGDSIEIWYSLVLPGAPLPISMAALGDTLYVLDGAHEWVIARYYQGESIRADTLELVGLIGDPKAITLWNDHLLVSSYCPTPLSDPGVECDFRLWEYNRDGFPHGSHAVYSPGPCSLNDITMVGDTLYAKGSDSDSILVFAPCVFQSEVPGGDSVAVNAIPWIVQVIFDRVSAEGMFTGEIVDHDPCPPPEGVALFSDFYHLGTTAQFDYAAEVAVLTPDGLPPGADPRHVRVFARPSGVCQYRDVTVAPTELPTTLTALTRTRSEDDEFSVFALGEDWRPPRAVIELKFEMLAAAITAGQDSIPPDPRMRIWNLYNAARSEYYRGRSALAAAYVDSIAITAREVPQIPHTFDPEVAGRNLAGKLISDAHTLSFSLRFSESVAMMTGAFLVPDHIDESPDGFIRSYQDVPPEFGTAEVDNQHIYIEHEVRAIPESTSVAWYPTGERGDIRRVRAVFHADEVTAVVPHVNETTLRLTCFIGGYEIFSDPTIFGPGAGVPDAPRDAASGLVIKSNPSSSSFGFEVSSGGAKPVEIRIYSVEGELVRVLSSGHPTKGASILTWHGDNQDGSRVSPGAYFVVARFDGRTITRKVILER